MCHVKGIEVGTGGCAAIAKVTGNTVKDGKDVLILLGSYGK